MKTAMQELIEELEVLENNTISLSDKFLIKSIRFKATAKLEKEKEQILRAFELGMHECLAYDANSIKYYNETYNVNK